jgi:hypothetical protein
MTVTHDDELLRVFKNTPDDLAANRSGRLSDAQARRLRRKAANAVLAMVVAVLVFATIIVLVGARPIAAWRWVLIVVVAGAGLAVGIYQGAKLRASARNGTVEAHTGPVTVALRGRNGWWLTVAGNRSFRLPVRFWHVGPGLDYHVYVAPAAGLIVAMETDAAPPTPIADPGPPEAPTLHQWAIALCRPDEPSGEILDRAAEIERKDDQVRSLYYEPGGTPLTRADLDAVFGAGAELVRVHYDSDHRVVYRVTVPEAPYMGVLTATFAPGAAPTSDSPVRRVRLDRQQPL